MFPWRKIRPSRCSTSDGFHGTSISCKATRRVWIFVPVPSFSVEPNIIRLVPLHMSWNISCRSLSFLASWTKQISFSGTPFFISSFFINWYTLNVLLPFGTPISENTTWVPRVSFVLFHISNTFSVHLYNFPFLSGSADGSSIRTSVDTSFASWQILSILSTEGSTVPFRIFSARCTNESTYFFTSSLGSDSIISNLLFSNSGISR